MTLPLQLVLGDAELAPLVEAELAAGGARAGVWVFAWDDQPEVVARAGRHAKDLLEATGARGEGGFARLVVGGRSEAPALPGPTPIVTLYLGLEGPGLIVPEQVGPRLVAPAARRAALARLVGWLVDVAAGARAREALTRVAEAIGEGAFALVGVGRFSVERLERRLVHRMQRAVAARVDALVRAGADGVALAPPLPDLDVDARAAMALGARVVDEGPALARRLAAEALTSADAAAEALRREVDRALASLGLAALGPLRRLLAELVHLAATRVGSRPTTPIARTPSPPSAAALEVARAAAARAAPPAPGTWPLEAAWALGGATAGAAAVGPFVAATTPGGGPGLAGGVGLLAAGVGALVTRVAEGVSRRRTARALAEAEAAFEAAWAEAARAWLEPLAALASRRAWSRLLRALEAERDALESMARGVDALARAPREPAGAAQGGDALEAAVALDDALVVLALPAEPLAARVDAAARRPEWREGHALLSPEGVQAAARAAYAAVGIGGGAGLPLAARTDLADALRGAVRDGVAALRGELVRWVPEGQPARRFVSLPAALGDALPPEARHDEALAATRDAWVVTLWRAA